ncbi:proline-rich protein 2-like [Monodon monoceros]|uniref:proline-rich protein 2-like n=1 Tax=Monodon monoceros TaxID=40151 RepID=UPI0010F6E3AB|nr:proline-rich protein 2-like [Monodon monoceros]
MQPARAPSCAGAARRSTGGHGKGCRKLDGAEKGPREPESETRREEATAERGGPSPTRTGPLREGHVRTPRDDGRQTDGGCRRTAGPSATPSGGRGRTTLPWRPRTRGPPTSPHGTSGTGAAEQQFLVVAPTHGPPGPPSELTAGAQGEKWERRQVCAEGTVGAGGGGVEHSRKTENGGGVKQGHGRDTKRGRSHRKPRGSPPPDPSPKPTPPAPPLAPPPPWGLERKGRPY